MTDRAAVSEDLCVDVSGMRFKQVGAKILVGPLTNEGATLLGEVLGGFPKDQGAFWRQGLEHLFGIEFSGLLEVVAVQTLDDGTLVVAELREIEARWPGEDIRVMW